MGRRKVSASRAIFVACNGVIMALFAFLCLAPFLNLLALSLSDSLPASSGDVVFLPLTNEGKIGFNFGAYQFLLKKPEFFRAFGISVLRVVLGVLICVSVELLAAYPLAKSGNKLYGRKFYVIFYTVTMFFSGGLIPTYLVLFRLNMLDKIMVLVLPLAANAWNMVLFINFFKQVPKDLEEYAFLEGAGPLRVLLQIVVPISLPAVATVTLFTAVAHWNNWFDGYIYMSSKNYPLQTYIYDIINQLTTLSKSPDPNTQQLIQNLPGKTIRSAQIFIAMVPIMLVYPFAQKFFIKGLVMGAVKE
ncbi:MAG: carbohydrate ABC transporter permease [Clostridia bacterium]|nr:carbohydrate ABC transporter permease [Clostridia bacterium]